MISAAFLQPCLTHIKKPTSRPIIAMPANRPVILLKKTKLNRATASKISRLPRDYGRFELGSRWLGNKLTIGGIMRYYGKSTRATTEEEFVDGTTGANTYSSHQMGRRVIKKTESINRQPMIFDFYANYEPKKNLILRFDIQNAFNKRYIDPLDAANDAATQRYFSVFERKGGLDDEEVECDANGLCNGKYGGTTRSVLNNYARGRTLLFTISYKF